MNDEREATTRDGAARPPGRHPGGGDDALGAALRALPAERAGAGFAARVMVRLDEPAGAGSRAAGRAGAAGRGSFLRPAAGWAALAAAALAVVLGLALVRGSGTVPGERLAAGTAGNPASDAPPAPASPGMSPSAGSEDRSESATPGSGRDPMDPIGGSSRVDHPAFGTGGVEAIPAGPDRSPRAGAGPDGSPAPDAPPRVSQPGEPARPAAAAVPPELRRFPEARPAAAPTADARAALARVRAELDALRRDHRRFEVGLAELPEIGRHGQPVVFVGGDEGLGLVLDLGREGSAAVADATDGGPTL